MNALVLTLVPQLQTLCVKHFLQSADAGLHWTVVQGRRTEEDQFELYARGREFRPGIGWHVTNEKAVVTNALPQTSPHCRGAAYDIAILTNGKPDWTAHDAYVRVGQIGKALGLTWGGDFNTLKHSDLGHFELKDWHHLPMEEKTA